VRSSSASDCVASRLANESDGPSPSGGGPFVVKLDTMPKNLGTIIGVIVAIIIAWWLVNVLFSVIAFVVKLVIVAVVAVLVYFALRGLLNRGGTD